MPRILIIDDSISVLEFMQAALEGAGHTVLRATCGSIGAKLLHEHVLDLVVTDMYMPDGDGVHVLRQARRFAPEIKLIAISSRPDTLNLFRVATSLGAVATLQKPFNAEQLLQSVNQALGLPAAPARHPEPIRS